jgi:hypothetical protein
MAERAAAKCSGDRICDYYRTSSFHGVSPKASCGRARRSAWTGTVDGDRKGERSAESEDACRRHPRCLKIRSSACPNGSSIGHTTSLSGCAEGRDLGYLGDERSCFERNDPTLADPKRTSVSTFSECNSCARRAMSGDGDAKSIKFANELIELRPEPAVAWCYREHHLCLASCMAALYSP